MKHRGKKNAWMKTTKGGFTLFEAIMVALIIGILTTITVANYRGFEKKITLENLAQDIALSVRLAQSYGLNVRGSGGADPFNTAYGVHFDAGAPGEYLIFRDSDRGPVFDYTGDVVEVFSLGSGYSIIDVCAVPPAPPNDCFVANGGTIDEFDITFDRPRPDAHFREEPGGGTNYQEGLIIIRDPKGATTTISVLSTGFISVQ